MTRKVWRDQEISAYVDGQLGNEEAAALKAAIAREPELRERVTLMERTVAWVQAPPLREPPRNYLLTPSMVAEKKTPSPSTSRRMPLWVMRLATSITAIAFVLSLGLNLLSLGGGQATLTSLPQTHSDQVQGMAESMPVERAMGLETPNVAALPPGSPEEEMALAPVPEMPAPPEGGVGGGAEAPVPEMEDEPLLERLEFSATDEGSPQEGAVDEAELVMDGGTGITQTDVMPPPEMGDTVESVPPPRPPFPPRWLTLALGIVTLLLGGMTFWLSRRA